MKKYPLKIGGVIKKHKHKIKGHHIYLKKISDSTFGQKNMSPKSEQQIIFDKLLIS